MRFLVPDSRAKKIVVFKGLTKILQDITLFAIPCVELHSVHGIHAQNISLNVWNPYTEFHSMHGIHVQTYIQCIESMRKIFLWMRNPCAEFYSVHEIDAHNFIQWMEFMCRISFGIHGTYVQNFVQYMEFMQRISFSAWHSCTEQSFHPAWAALLEYFSANFMQNRKFKKLWN